MDRHDVDPIALVFGAAFVAIGLAEAVARWNWLGVDRAWVIGVLLIAVGVAGALSATRRRIRPDA